MAGARSHEELIVWRLAYELKLGVYVVTKSGPITGDRKLLDQLQSAASAAPRLIAEGYGRYLPGDFSRYLRAANGELKETFDALRDAVDRGHLTQDQIVPLQRLSKRASKAATQLIKYLRTATAPHEEPRRRSHRRSTELSRGLKPEPPKAEPPEPDSPEPEPTEPEPTEPEPPEQDP